MTIDIIPCKVWACNGISKRNQINPAYMMAIYAWSPETYREEQLLFRF